MAEMKNNIKNARLAKHLSQSALAKKINISRQAISKYENGDREPKLTTWKKLSKALEASVSYLQNMGDSTMSNKLNLTESQREMGDKFATALMNDDVMAVISIDEDDSLNIISNLSDEDTQSLLIEALKNILFSDPEFEKGFSKMVSDLFGNDEGDNEDDK